MNNVTLIERLMAERKSLDTLITEFEGSIHYRHPRKNWQRISRVESERPLDVHLKTLAWVEKHA